MMEWAKRLTGLSIQPAVGYLDFLNLLANARMVFTDSGGVQQEACIHQIPTVTLRENTEWVETLEDGANRLAGTDAARIAAAAQEAMAMDGPWPIPFGDGRAAEYILDAVGEFLAERD